MSVRLNLLASVATIACGLAVPAVAHADCQADIEPLAKRMETVTDEQVKTRLFFAIRRARMELDEYDEAECQQTLDAATKLLPPSK